MKKPIISALAFSLLPLFFINYCYAQKASADSSVSSYVESYIVSNYNKVIGQQSRLYNGAEYTPYNPLIKSSPYFNDLAGVKPGTVKFDGYTYNNVPLMYDLYKDVLVAQLYNKFSLYSLASERVTSFDLDAHHFVYISADTVSNSTTFSSGFYEQLYRGKSEALVRYSKTMQNASSALGEIDTYFTKVKKQFFIKKGEAYITVSSEGDLLSALKDHKKELQQYIKGKNIRFKSAPEEALISITSYYDHLTN